MVCFTVSRDWHERERANLAMELADGNITIERGKMLEPDAVELFEFDTGYTTQPIGFITNDAGTIGCSPDRFVNKGKGGILEIKCPAPQTHVGYMAEGFDPKYKPQVQGQLYITDLQVCTWFSFHPNFPPVTMRIERDDEYIKILAESLNQFVAMKAALLKQIKDAGHIEKRQSDATFRNPLMAG